MAIIRVNTVGEARPPQPAVPSLQEGVPLDFEFYARRTYGGKNAVQKALRAIAESIRSPHTESVATPESVVSENLRTHPCLYADAAAIHANERVPDKWLISAVSLSAASCARSVGSSSTTLRASWRHPATRSG